MQLASAFILSLWTIATFFYLAYVSVSNSAFAACPRIQNAAARLVRCLTRSLSSPTWPQYISSNTASLAACRLHDQIYHALAVFVHLDYIGQSYISQAIILRRSLRSDNSTDYSVWQIYFVPRPAKYGTVRQRHCDVHPALKLLKTI